MGLGNPGKEYEKNIHNLGYLAIDNFASNHSMEFSKNKFFGRVAEGMINGEKIILIKPETFMNASGKSVEACVNLLKIDLSHVVVLVDDIDLDFGKIRVREKGSAGTHNGLRDIVHRLGENFPRLRIGAGRPNENQDLANYVLGNMSKEKMQILEDLYPKINNALEYFITNKKFEGLDVNKI